MSSANMAKNDVIKFLMSVVLAIKSRGSSTDPWDTPLRTLIELTASPIFTLKVRSLRNESIHRCKLPRIPRWSTLSNVFEKSRYTIPNSRSESASFVQYKWTYSTRGLTEHIYRARIRVVCVKWVDVSLEMQSCGRILWLPSPWPQEMLNWQTGN